MTGIRYTDSAPPKHGRTVELCPGLFWARIQLPFKPGHVNVWLLSEPGGWTIVDAGFDSEVARFEWTCILESLGNPRIRRVVLTHAHFDHVGLAGWLCAKVAAPLWIAQTEFLYVKYLQSDWSLLHFVEFYGDAGSPATLLDTLADYQKWVWNALSDLPASFVRIRHGNEIAIGERVWSVKVSGGHAAEQLAFWCERDNILIAGDQVLPRISPAIHVSAEQPEADPLADAYAGWKRLRELPAETMVLPSHGEPFQGLHFRLDQLLARHDGRLVKLARAAGSGLSPHEALEVIFPDALPSSPRIATGEMLAHLNHLAINGSLVKERRADGVWQFRAT